LRGERGRDGDLGETPERGRVGPSEVKREPGSRGESRSGKGSERQEGKKERKGKIFMKRKNRSGRGRKRGGEERTAPAKQQDSR
jgi:hypothetical protein